MWVQKYWMDNGRCFTSERITDGYGAQQQWGGTKENVDTKFDRIPAYVILNDGLSGDTDGESEVAELSDDDAWYGKLKSYNIDALRKGMNQITWMSGVDPESSQNFRYVPGALWDIKADPSQASGDSNAATVHVGTISNGFEYSAAFQNSLSNIKQDMRDLLGIPDLNQESTKDMITSGKGLKALYWPLICRCEEKMASWKPALEWLAELLLSAADAFPALHQVYGDFKAAPYAITIDNQYPLPEDEGDEKQLDLSEVNDKTRSAKSYIMKWGGAATKGTDPDDADAELEQIAKEQQMFNDSFVAEPELIGGAE
ncbi:MULTISPECIES: phage portal protein [Caproicibacterium]|jgi:hypothetical protein|uniref:Phage portal protein n=1 Tax=Caproicibacterium lactatifermentans TaxID=2666138 RepID=A0A859DRC9_9FIRM|nr:phage portal protein [Caproicibacterium lactatifermentans]ARP49986.1 hypothetical protein B6259_03280 [Ruminococcaceae bacterium CPB6]QKN24236.1 phage portal protein [Caproicibacterium lactatifermentans]QKO30692.1 phage portal protein [Caproicibacterium lactatifermentans]